MNLLEKQKIAEIAIRLIRLLKMCDDYEFAKEVLDCVKSGDESIIELRYTL